VLGTKLSHVCGYGTNKCTNINKPGDHAICIWLFEFAYIGACSAGVAQTGTMAFGNSKARSALQDATRMMQTIPGKGLSAQRLILDAAQRRARHAASLVAKADDRSGSKLWADATLLSAECSFMLGDFDSAIATMMASASAYLKLAHRDKDADLANATYELSRFYSRLGDGKRAGVFAAETYKRSPRKERDLQRLIWCQAAIIAAGDRVVVAELLSELTAIQVREPEASMFLMLEHVSGYRRHSLGDLVAANERIAAGVSAESSVLFGLAVANELRNAGQLPQARGVLEALLERLDAEAAPPWTQARVRQVVADLLLRELRYREALDAALASWVVLDEGRYRTGSSRLRRTIQDSYALARRTAMSAAASLHDWALLSELIESARLQAGSDIEGSLAEFDVAADGHHVAHARGATRRPTRTIHIDELPAPLNLIYEDLTDGRTDLGPPADISVAGNTVLASSRERHLGNALHMTSKRTTLPLETYVSATAVGHAVWWSTWYERGLLFWTLWLPGGSVEGGQIDLETDHDLRWALTACCEGNGMRPPWPISGLRAFDLNEALLHCGSPSELELTRALGHLMPAQLSAAAQGKSAFRHRPRLLISPAPELSCVPWPILPIGPQAESRMRLIEFYELQFIPSLASIAAAPPAAAQQQETVPFTMSCDYFEPDNFPAPPQKSAFRFGTARQRATDPGIALATPEAVATFLRHLDPGSPGLTVFRTHFVSVGGDPTASGFQLDNGRLEVGWLLPRDVKAGRTVLGMTTRVLLSCCSTSAAQERYGGESLGLVAACISCGARMIIATSVNIPHTSFTNRFDERLTEMMLGSASHVRGLRDLQCQMLREWRGNGGRNIGSAGGDINDPLPIVWAYYQACGLG